MTKQNNDALLYFGTVITLLIYVSYREAAIRKSFSDWITDHIDHDIKNTNRLYKILTDYMLVDTRNDCKQERINLTILNAFKTATGSVDEEIENLIYERVKRIRECEEKLEKFEKERDEELSEYEN